MLNAVKGEIKSKYYDENFHGIDIDARFKVAEEKIDSATSLNQAFGIIAQAVLELNDSHTTFFPPNRAGLINYGWRMQMIGDKCIVTSVKPKSDAEKQGLKQGDEILKIEGFIPTRKEMWKISYYYNLVSPRQGLNITVKSSNEKNPRELNIASKITPLPSYVDFNNLIRDITLSDGKVIENRFIKVGKTAIWQMPTFAIDPSVVEGFMKGDIIQNSSNLIIDLRGNGGGYVVTLEALAGYFVNEDKKIADLKGRKEMKPQMAKTRKSNVYKGNLIILIDSRSASASEIFARFMQLEQRGVVIGDVSAGAVMQSIGVPLQMGDAKVILYGMSLTNADVIMSDGKSLEHSGVTPQLYLIPTPQEISLGQDKVLATALKLFDENVSPEEAGKFFPYKWEDK